MPTTLNRAYLGTMPKGVSSPCGLVTVTTEPTVAPSWSAISLPSTMGASEAVSFAVYGLVSSEVPDEALVVAADDRASEDPQRTEFNRSLTLFSSEGMIPLRTAPCALA